jgi:hypothetical protein
MVPADCLDAARATFALRDRGELEAALTREYPPEDVACRKCGSTTISERRDWMAIVLAVVLQAQ